VIVVKAAADLPIELDPVLADQPVTLIDCVGRRLRKVVAQPGGRRRRIFQDAAEIVGVEVVDGEYDTDLLRTALSDYLAASGIEIDHAEDLETFAREAAQRIC